MKKKKKKNKVKARKRCGDFAADNKADAFAIAMAPELLLACKEALSVAESWIHDQLDGTTQLSSALSGLDGVRATIAKFEGRNK